MTIVDFYEKAGPQVVSECDNVAHGYGCMCLRGKNAEGEIEDEILWGLEEALDQALVEEEEAEGEVEYAEERFEEASARVNQLEAAIAKHKKGVDR